MVSTSPTTPAGLDTSTPGHTVRPVWWPPRADRLLVLVLVAVGLAVLGSPRITRPIDRYALGDFTTRSIRAPYDLSIVDEVATRQQQAAAAANAPLVATFDARVATVLESRFASAWTPVADVMAQAQAADGNATPPARATTRATAASLARKRTELLDRSLPAAFAEVEQRLAVPVPQQVREFVQEPLAVQRAVEAFGRLTAMAYLSPVVADPSVFLPLIPEEHRADPRPDVLLVDRATGATTLVGRDRGLRDLAAVRTELQRRAPALLPDVAQPIADWLASVAVAWLRPNVVPDEGATRDMRQAAIDAVLPASLTFHRNQLIVGEGQPVTRQTLLVLDALREQRFERSGWKRLGGRAGVILSLLLLAFWTVRHGRARFAIDTSHFSFAVTSLVGTAVAFRFWLELVGSVAARYPAVPETAAVLCFPATAAVMHASVVLPYRATVMYLAVQSVILGVLSQTDLLFVIYLLIAGAAASLLVSRCDRRQCVLKAGLWTGLVVAPVAVCLALLGDTSLTAAAWTAGGAAAGGVLSGLTALAVGPVFEWVFGHLTRIRLVELMNYQHPLLRRLTETTPGTFQHSVTIGLLADGAARAIDADTLLARVGALYHDVGKLEHPECFVENQQGINPHDHLSPTESARLIIGHVEDGVRLVRDAGLSERIADFVREHHGTSQVRYFLAKAEREGSPVDPSDFTYPGPRPRSRETGILMVADQVEATARAMDAPTEANLREMVRGTVSRILGERQLDECPLTLQDMSAIQEAFVQVLTGVHHRRIKYPSAARPVAEARS